MKNVVRYASYPLIMGAMVAAALSVVGGALMPWPALAVLATVGIPLVALLERAVPYEAAWAYDHGDVRADVVHAVANWALLSAAAWIVGAVTGQLGAPTLWSSRWPVGVQLALVAVVLDLGLYAMHVLSHRWPWAWRLHAIHHSAQWLYWLNGERRHPLSALLMGGPGLLVLAVLGAPSVLISAWLAVLAVHLAFQHANLDYRLGPLRRWIAGAETHRWHHKREYEDAQVNFGEMLLVWDRVFGTFVDPGTRLGADEVGLRHRTFPTRYLAQLRWPFHIPQEIRSAFEARVEAGREAIGRGEPGEAMQHLEAAHILGQSWTTLHVRSHVVILRSALAMRQWHEVTGQLPRIVAAALFTWLWVPSGNPGSTRVGALVRQPVPDTLASILSRAGR